MAKKKYDIQQSASNHAEQCPHTQDPCSGDRELAQATDVELHVQSSTVPVTQNGVSYQSPLQKQNGTENGVVNHALQMQDEGKDTHVIINGVAGDKPWQKDANGNCKDEDSDEKESEGEAQEKSGCFKKKRGTKQPAVGILELFRYAGPVEVLMIFIGSLFAMVAGCTTPINTMVLGSVVDIFIENIEIANQTGQSYGDLILEEIKPVTLYFVAIGCTCFVSCYLAVSMWTWAGERQITKIRKLFFRGIMRLDIGWFDTHETGELNSRFSDDMHKISEGLCDKVAVFIQWVTTFVACFVISFVKGWKLALVAYAFSPLFILSASFMARMLRRMSVKEFQAYAKAGAVAEQAFRAIRTVQAFQGQEKEQKRYENNLVYAKEVAVKKGLVFGLGGSAFWFIIFVAFAVCYYYGVVLIQTDNFNPGNVLVVFFTVLMGSMSLGHAFPNLESFSNARAAAVKIFEVISLHPTIDISSSSGKKLTELKGVIEFRNVHFRYPARPEVKVLQGLNLTVNPDEDVALVGASGSGKSTTVQLLQRFYDPEEGQILVDGHDVRDLNLKWLREQIGVVSQEPVLFATTIAENIRYGRPDVTQSEIEAAAKEANAHDFIMKLPEAYETLIGERGAQLSGGQKQRIAIARALVRNPRILLLDEATSALDHESEAIVQNALEKAGVGRTTIVIAHRLSTIRYADRIVSLSHGLKEEEGSHDELMARDGLYAQLVKLQTKAEKETGEDLGFLEIVQNDDDDLPAGEHLLKPVFMRSLSAESARSRTLSIRSSLRSKKGKDGDEREKSQEEKEKEPETQPASLKRLLQLNSPEWLQILMGVVFSAICGLSHPSFAFIFSEFIMVFSLTDRDEQQYRAMILALVLASVGVGLAIFRLGLSVCFAKSGAALTARLRSLTFKAILKQDMSFFDSPENQVGALTTRLANDAALVQGATGSKIGTILEALSTVIASLIIAFVYGWKLTLVILAFLPIMVIAGKVQGRVISGSAKSEKSQLKEAGKICSEAVDNIRTVASLNREDIFISKLEKLLNEYNSIGARTAHLFGVTYGLATSIQYFAFAAAFTYGTHLIADGEMEFFHVFRVLIAVVMGGAAVGRQSSFSVDLTKGEMAAGRLFRLIDLKPKIDITEATGDKLDNYSGTVQIRSVVFHYPTRPTVPVLSQLSLEAEPGQTVALVGSSGCGKSTVLQLLQRFYDPDSGSLAADGQDIRKMDLRWFRQQLGIVSQEPTLFDGSIASNIAYGDNSRQVPMAEIIAAARAANIHGFIESLPQGYDTNVGDKGTQLSGGQKQRIAIARALVRRPKVLLLDEATSALDTESERVVQEALDKAREGRTCIVIAHRLTTIQNADRIAVIDHGQVQEMGTHSELLAQHGAYYRLLQAQNRNM